jgi:hypothetical protein
LSYRARSSGSNYGNQRRRSGSTGYYGNKNRRKSMPYPGILRQQTQTGGLESDNLVNNENTAFSMFAKASETWDKPAWNVPLPSLSDVNKQEQQAYLLSRVAAGRKVEIVLFGPDNQPIKKYAIKKIEANPNNQPLEPDSLVPNCLSRLKTALEGFGFTLQQLGSGENS